MADLTLLKGLIPDELFNQLDTLLKENPAKLADLSKGDYVDKNKYEAEKAKATKLEEDSKEVAKQIEEFKKLDPKALEAKVNEWQTKYETDKAAWEKQQTDQALDFKIREALAAAKAKDPNDIMPHLQRDILKLEGDKVIGLEEQLKGLTEKKAYLFGEASTDPNVEVITGGGKTGKTEQNPFNFVFAGMPKDKPKE